MWKAITTVAMVAVAGGAGYGLGIAAPAGKRPVASPEPIADKTAELELANVGFQRELHSCRKTISRLMREKVATSRATNVPPTVPAGSSAPGDTTAQPTEQEPMDEPILLRREYLDERIESLPTDPQWQSEVGDAVAEILSKWPGAETLSTRCSKALCRVDFTTGQQGNGLEAIMDQLNAMPEVEGERLIQIDETVDPPVATAYFGRDGAISLATP